jgi:hypothetical protein
MAAAVEHELSNGWLRAIPIDGEPPRKEIYLIRREGESHDGPAMQFMNLLGGHSGATENKRRYV